MAKTRTGNGGGLASPAAHAVMAAAAVVLVGAASATAIHFLGDSRSAAPRVVVSLDPDNKEGSQGPVRAPLSEVLVDPAIDAGIAHDGADHGLDPMQTVPPDGVLRIADAPGAAAEKPKPLPRAPLPGLTQASATGPLPVISPSGQTPFKAYRRPWSGDAAKPKIAIVVGGLGFNARATQQAIDDLPADVTLSFVPYAKDLQGWIDKARADGHEVMIELPMEPLDRDADTGPQTLTVNASAKDNVARLENLLSRGTGYFAVMNYLGGKFAGASQAVAPVVRVLRERGLALVGNGVSARSALGVESQKALLPFVAADRVVDIRQDAESIDDQLLNLEAFALQNGSALGAGFAYPVTIEQIRSWADGLAGRGYSLAPVSAILESRAGAR